MKLASALAIVIPAMFLAGCLVPSVQPLYTDKELIYEPGLIGNWKDAKDPDKCSFRRSGGKGYEVIYSDDKDTVVFLVHLVRLGGYQFLDVTTKDGGIVKDHLINGHSFWRIRIEKDAFEVATFDEQIVRKMVDTKQLKLAQRIGTSDSVVWTAPTPQLQEFLMRHSEDAGLFDEPGRFVRVP